MLTFADNRAIVLGDAASTDASRGVNLDVLSSVLIGLAAPMIAVMLIDPTALRHTRVVVALLLTTIFFISVILFAHSLLLPGNVRAVAFDPVTRIATLIRDGLFAANDLDIPFGLIKSLRVEQTGDADGHANVKAMLVMTTREAIELPIGTTESHLAAIRQKTGLP